MNTELLVALGLLALFLLLAGRGSRDETVDVAVDLARTGGKGIGIVIAIVVLLALALPYLSSLR